MTTIEALLQDCPFNIAGPITDIDMSDNDWLTAKLIHLAKLPDHVDFALGIEVDTDRKVQLLAACGLDDLVEAIRKLRLTQTTRHRSSWR
jgi:hypothetical protein